MSTRVVNIKLQADASGVVAGFAAARDAAGEVKAEIAETARSARQDWTTVGQGLTAVGLAITGVGVAALKTGVQYNTLQQTTRAALTTLLGSAEAANAQMDRLDDFARNSPFAKQTFIQAQQQMLGFGVEAQKVVPALDAIQNAVAAMGGSNEQISAISEIISRINSESRLSGDALQRLGYYGIDAAEIIGSQMGKSAAEIRDMARKPGGIPVEQIWDPLVTGLQEKFGGAAENVKNTFDGAVDRVKAAWRDFASELARPLVNPDGGGALVDLLNWAADAMRAFENLPTPVKTATTMLVGVVGAGALLVGSAMLVVPKLIELGRALASVGLTAGFARNSLHLIGRFLLGPWGIALSAAAITMGVLNEKVKEGVPAQADLVNMLSGSASAAEQLAAASNQADFTWPWMGDFKAKLRDLPTLLTELKGAASEVSPSLANMLQGNKEAAETLGRLGDALAEMAQSDLPAAQREFAKLATETGLNGEQASTLLGQMPALRSELVQQATSAGLAATDMTLLGIAMGEIDPAAEAQRNSLEGLSGAATSTAQAISDLADEIANFGKAQFDMERAAITLQEKLGSLNEILVEGSGSLDIHTEAGQKTKSALLDVAEAANREASAILEATEDHEAANAVLDDTRQRLVEAMVALGEDEAVARQWADSKIAATQAVNQKVKDHKAAIESIPTRWDSTIHADVQGATEGERILNNLARQREALIRITYSDSRGGSTGKGESGAGGGGGFSGGRAYGGTIGTPRGLSVRGIAGGVSNGTVYGKGGTKSDSILVPLSRGEEVIQEPYASMFRPELKAINRGDFVSSQQQQQVIVVAPPAEAGPLVGSLTMQSSGNMHSDIAELNHYLRKISRGGKYVGSR